MPDYDPQSIPVLDDIIEEEKTDETDIGTEKINDGANVKQADNNFNLFDNDADNDTDDDGIDTAINTVDAVAHEPGLGAIDDIIEHVEANAPAIGDSAIVDATSYDQPGAETEAVEAKPVESALMAYPDEEESVPVIASVNHNSDEQLTANLTLSDNEKTASVPQVSLESIADDIVDNIVDHLLTQLLPDLELQLRLLVHQALEDKLPGELLNKDSTDEAS